MSEVSAGQNKRISFSIGFKGDKNKVGFWEVQDIDFEPNTLFNIYYFYYGNGSKFFNISIDQGNEQD